MSICQTMNIKPQLENTSFRCFVKEKLSQCPRLFKLVKRILDFFRSLFQSTTQKNSILFRKHLYQISNQKTQLKFVKVGANDGLTGDPCSQHFLDNAAWEGYFIEPVPYLYQNLCNNFSGDPRFHFCNLAISNESGYISFYYFDPLLAVKYPEVAEWYHQLGSFSRDHIIKNSDSRFESYILERKVRTSTLDDFFEEKKITSIDFLQIDVEGHDFKVLQSMSLDRIKPLSILIEHKHIENKSKRQMVKLLKKNGYRLFDCGCDFFCLNKKAFRSLKKQKSFF